VAYLDKEVHNMLAKDAIYENKAKNLVLSSIYTVPKKDSDKRRPVINLRWVNQHIKRIHFKMATMKDVKAAITKDCYMAKLDLSDCFWGLPVHPKDQRFLSFHWRGKNYSFKCLPFGLSVSPLFITKLYHHVVEELQAKGHRVILYIDDMLILGDSRNACERTVTEVRALFRELGAIVNAEKSVFTPSQTTEYLGFVLDSKKMTISAPKYKLTNMTKGIKKFIRKGVATPRDVASVLGKINSLADALFPARVHTTGLRNFQLQCLQRNSAWDRPAPIPEPALRDAIWWSENMFPLNGRSLLPPVTNARAATDASDFSWGAWLQEDAAPSKTSWGGHFSNEIAAKHINYKELMAVKYLIQSVPDRLHGKTIDLGIDNTTALWYIKRMGGRRKDLALLAQEIFGLLQHHQIELVAYHLPGVKNVLADQESRKTVQLSDAKLNSDLFRQIDNTFGPHSVDLFATFQDRQLNRFASWQPQPRAAWIDAMTPNWSNENAWINPPFSMISRVLQKVEQDQATVTLLAPLWPGQPWFPKLLMMLVDLPLVVPNTDKTFLYPAAAKTLRPPSWTTLVWRISGDLSSNTGMRRKLSRMLSRAGSLPQLKATKATGPATAHSQLANRKIQQLQTTLRLRRG
jgi:hypothetical protein